MRIKLVTPSPKGLLDGNRVTARRWARLMRKIGHQTTVGNQYDGNRCDLLIALHAFKSSASIRHFHQDHPDKPLIVALSGTDLYRDIHEKDEVNDSLKLATHLVVLQKHARTELPESVRQKVHVIYQSAQPLKGNLAPPKSYFRVCVVGNLRPEKDPFRTALASRRLAASSRIRIVHVGTALRQEMEQRALAETRRNRRYRWVGPLPYWRTQRLIASSHLLALTSHMEGSSNVLSEALIGSIPVVASKIAGLVGTLGENYPGFFPTEDTQALASLLEKAETDSAFYRELKAECARCRWLIQPQREQRCWEKLLKEICSKK